MIQMDSLSSNIFCQKCVSKGVASGPIHFFQRASTTITGAPAAAMEGKRAVIRIPVFCVLL